VTTCNISYTLHETATLMDLLCSSIRLYKIVCNTGSPLKLLLLAYWYFTVTLQHEKSKARPPQTADRKINMLLKAVSTEN
jgi:hypothetical protein